MGVALVIADKSLITIYRGKHVRERSTQFSWPRETYSTLTIEQYYDSQRASMYIISFE